MVVMLSKKCDQIQQLKEIVSRYIGGRGEGLPPWIQLNINADGYGRHTTVHEIKQIISKAVQEGIKGKLEVQSLRDTASEGKNTSIQATQEIADKLLDIERIKVAYTNCYIRARLSIQRLQMLEAGHSVRGRYEAEMSSLQTTGSPD